MKLATAMLATRQANAAGRRGIQPPCQTMRTQQVTRSAIAPMDAIAKRVGWRSHHARVAPTKAHATNQVPSQ